MISFHPRLKVFHKQYRNKTAVYRCWQLENTTKSTILLASVGMQKSRYQLGVRSKLFPHLHSPGLLLTVLASCLKIADFLMSNSLTNGIE